MKQWMPIAYEPPGGRAIREYTYIRVRQHSSPRAGEAGEAMTILTSWRGSALTRLEFPHGRVLARKACCIAREMRGNGRIHGIQQAVIF